MLRDAVARVLGRPDARAAEEPALGLWALVHGLVELELGGLLPDGAAQRYVHVLRTAGQATDGIRRPSRSPDRPPPSARRTASEPDLPVSEARATVEPCP